MDWSIVLHCTGMEITLSAEFLREGAEFLREGGGNISVETQLSAVSSDNVSKDEVQMRR